MNKRWFDEFFSNIAHQILIILDNYCYVGWLLESRSCNLTLWKWLTLHQDTIQSLADPALEDYLFLNTLSTEANRYNPIFAPFMCHQLIFSPVPLQAYPEYLICYQIVKPEASASDSAAIELTP